MENNLINQVKLLNVVILAGGKGKRMKSDLPKVLHTVDAKSMLSIVITKALNIRHPNIKVHVVMGEFQEQICQDLSKWGLLNKINVIIQKEALGTGHAVQCCYNDLINTSRNNSHNSVLVLFGDMPNISQDLLDTMVATHFKLNQNLLGILELKNPFGYGRIIKSNKNSLVAIVEEKDANEEQKKIKLVNTGLFLLNFNELKEHLFKLDNNNKQNEYYLTDIVQIFRQNNITIHPFNIRDPNEIVNVNTPEQLQKVRKLYMDAIKDMVLH